MLVIEDNLVNQQVIKLMLDQMGVSVVLASDGQQGLDVILQGITIDLILTDLHMPVMDGFDATRHIRQFEAKAHQARCPIIALTADAFSEVRTLCFNAGMDDVLTKPVVFETLRSMFVKWMPPAVGHQHSAEPVSLPSLNFQQ